MLSQAQQAREVASPRLARYGNCRDVELMASNMVTANGSTDYSLMTPNGAIGELSVGYNNGATFEDAGQQSACLYGDYWVGGLHRDEDNPASIIGAVANSCQDHKIWDVSRTGNAIIYSLPCHGMGRPTICETALLNGTNQFPTPNGAMACAMLRNQTLYDPNYRSASPAAA